jgi:LuxR family transcriptional regulator, maltose regulon positive regulatory protein
VRRERLLDRLRDGRGQRLTLVCAPAGYGKTTLLVQWAAEDRNRTPFVWLSLEEADADPVHLWNQVIVGLHQVHAPVGRTSADALTAGPQAIAPVAIPLLVNELVDAPRLVLVLEDWHVLRNTVCDDTMRAFVAHVPDAVQVVISSRSDPGLPLARLRAHNDLAEVRAHQLRLSLDESHEVLRRADVQLGDDDIELLTDRTEGWAAGLHLASIALRDEPDPSAFVEAFSGDSRHVLDYLAEDVLNAVSGDIRTFLLRTSILETLSAPLCDAVLERSDSADVLAGIERGNLFLVSVDESRQVYRYHQLFATMLRHELERLEPGAVSTLHARASAWFESQGYVEACVDHAIASRDMSRASDLVTAHSREYWASGRTATLTRWLDSLSWPEAVRDAQLAITRASALGLAGSPADEMEKWILVASAGAHPGPLANGMQSIESGIALIRSLILTKGLEVAREAGARAVELEPPASAWRRQALAGLGQAHYLLGDAAGASAAFEQARRVPDSSAQAPGAAMVLAYLAFLEIDAGRAASAERLARDALALLEERHLTDAPAAANPQLALGAALMLSSDGHGAVDHLERSAELSASHSPSYWHVHALLRLADARHRIGRHAEAREAFEAGRSELAVLPDSGILGPMLEETERLLDERHRREGFLGEPLSESEQRVLRLLADGRSLAEVAKELFLSLNTVKTHRRTIYRKLGATTREEALERAAELGLTAPQGAESPG